MLFRRRDCIPTDCRKNLYFALVQLKIQYGIALYGFSTQKLLKELYASCNRILRTLQNRHRYYNVRQLYINFNTLPVMQLHELNIGTMIYKCLNGNTLMSSVIREIFQLNHVYHTHNTRLSITNHLYIQKNVGFYHSYAFKCCTRWNKIPLVIRNASSIKIFKSLYSKHLIDNCELNITDSTSVEF